ncbi:TPA: hypothetical protein ACRN0L_006538, partial [Pseudomonas aeruginosa]
EATPDVRCTRLTEAPRHFKGENLWGRPFHGENSPHFNTVIWPLHNASAPMQNRLDSLFDTFAIQDETPDVIEPPIRFQIPPYVAIDHVADTGTPLDRRHNSNLLRRRIRGAFRLPLWRSRYQLALFVERNLERTGIPIATKNHCADVVLIHRPSTQSVVTTILTALDGIPHLAASWIASRRDSGP